MVTLNLSGWPVWQYTVGNSQPGGNSCASGDPQWITQVALAIHAPVTNVQSPPNWGVMTDYSTYIVWHNKDVYPFPNHIRPAESLSGFSFQSTGDWQCGLWRLLYHDHAQNVAGLQVDRIAPVPTAAVAGEPTPRPLQQSCPSLTATTPDHVATFPLIFKPVPTR